MRSHGGLRNGCGQVYFNGSLAIGFRTTILPQEDQRLTRKPIQCDVLIDRDVNHTNSKVMALIKYSRPLIEDLVILRMCYVQFHDKLRHGQVVLPR